MYESEDCSVPPIGAGCRVIQSGLVSRPSLTLNIEHIEFVQTSGYFCSWSFEFGVWRRLRDSNVQIDKYTDISDSQLDHVARQV